MKNHNPNQGNAPHPNPPAPAAPQALGGADGAARWKQVQDLLLSDHQKSVDARFHDTGARLAQESERLANLVGRLEHRHNELVQALEREVQERQRLANEVAALRKSHVAREDLAGRLRKLADKFSPPGE